MVIAGLSEAITVRTVDLNRVRAAQNKIVIALFLEDAHMWHQAVQEFHYAAGATR
ncbi:host cell division inhibitory peptide Kil [Yokenella regensburgei]